MKLKEYKSFCDLLTKKLKRKMFPFNDFGEAQRIKDKKNIIYLPTNNQQRKRAK
tara:strand:- start:404 stop:565 length:162 start_codon:yes stop_codon:yes gene_type:complete